MMCRHPLCALLRECVGVVLHMHMSIILLTPSSSPRLALLFFTAAHCPFILFSHFFFIPSLPLSADSLTCVLICLLPYLPIT